MRKRIVIPDCDVSISKLVAPDDQGNQKFRLVPSNVKVNTLLLISIIFSSLPN